MKLDVKITIVDTVFTTIPAGTKIADVVITGSLDPSITVYSVEYLVTKTEITTVVEITPDNLKVINFEVSDRLQGETILFNKSYPKVRAKVQDKFSKPNTIYKITKDIDLNYCVLTIPEGCTLDFQGGKFLNAKNIEGSVCNEYLMPEWFGGKNDGSNDCTYAFDAIFKISKSIKCASNKKYRFEGTVNARLHSELYIDLDGSSLIDFHIVINMNDALNDWRHAYTRKGLTIKNGTIDSKSESTKYLHWLTPVIISGGPLYIDNINLNRAPYFIALADRYIDNFTIRSVRYSNYGGAYDDVEYNLDAISVVKSDGTFAKIADGVGISGDSWIFEQLSEFYTPHLISLRAGSYTLFQNCIQCNINLSDFARANFIGCHWEGTKVSILKGVPVFNFIGCYFYIRAGVINTPNTTYTGCYFRGLADRNPTDLTTIKLFLQDTDIVDLKCKFINCIIGYYPLNTNAYIESLTNDAYRNTFSLRQSALDSFNSRNMTILNSGAYTPTGLALGNYKYTIYLMSGTNTCIAKREIDINITEQNKATNFYIINAVGGYGFLVYKTCPDGKIYKVKGMSVYNQSKNNFSFIDYNDFASIGEHDNSANMFMHLWEEVNVVLELTLYPHLYHSKGQLVTVSGNLSTPTIKAVPLDNINSTTKRPVDVSTGFLYYDTTLKKPIWWNGTVWVDATGTAV